GSLRMMPNWETHIFHHTISWNIIIPGVNLPGIMFNLIAMYPAIESLVTKDKGYHNLLDRPHDRPVRTALGVMSLPFYMTLVLAAKTGYDLHAHQVPATTTGSNGHRTKGSADAPSSGGIKRPVGRAEATRRKLDSFWSADREPVPDAHAADHTDEDTAAHH